MSTRLRPTPAVTFPRPQSPMGMPLRASSTISVTTPAPRPWPWSSLGEDSNLGDPLPGMSSTSAWAGRRLPCCSCRSPHSPLSPRQPRAALTERFPRRRNPLDRQSTAQPVRPSVLHCKPALNLLLYILRSNGIHARRTDRLSGESWSDGVTGELPNIYIYSVNNPSEGSIAKPRSSEERFHISRPQSRTSGTLKNLVMATGKREKSGSASDCSNPSRNDQRQLNLSVTVGVDH